MNQAWIIRPYAQGARDSLNKATTHFLKDDRDGTFEALLTAIDMLSQGLDRLAELVIDD